MSYRIGVVTSVLLAMGCGGMEAPPPPAPDTQTAPVTQASLVSLAMQCTGTSDDVGVSHSYQTFDFSENGVLVICEATQGGRTESSVRFYTPNDESYAWAVCTLDLPVRVHKAQSEIWLYRSNRALRAAGVTYAGIDPGYALNCSYRSL